MGRLDTRAGRKRLGETVNRFRPKGLSEAIEENLEELAEATDPNPENSQSEEILEQREPEEMHNPFRHGYRRMQY